MIITMRKELRKLSGILWIVLAGLALSSLAALVFRPKLPREIKIASVNGEAIYAGDFNSQYLAVQMRVEQVKMAARAQGFSPELFIAILGLSDPRKTALDEVVINKLLEGVQNKLNISIDPNYVSDEISKGIPPQLIDSQGNVDQNAYREYLNRMHLSIGEYEEKLENEIKKSLVKNLIVASSYVSALSVIEGLKEDASRKSFDILEIVLSDFVKKEKEKTISKEDLLKFFDGHKSAYKVPEKRRAEYWTLSPKDYSKHVSLTDRSIENFYEKNKSSLFRIPPEVNVRHLFIKIDSSKSAEETRRLMMKAKELHLQAVASPDKFNDLIKKHSDSLVGLTGFFKKGTGCFEEEFEKTAFRLKETNEVVGPIKVKNGIEILQLVDRNPATYKPLSAVRNDIIATVKARKALNQLRGDLEGLKHSLRNDPNTLDRFVKAKELSSKTTELLAQEEAVGHELPSTIVNRLFERKLDSMGYFEHEGDYVLYKPTTVEKSYVPKLADIKDTVIEDYYALEAQNAMREAARKLRFDIINKQKSLIDFKGNAGVRFSQTGMLTKDSSISGIKDSKELLGRAFALVEPAQVLKDSVGENYYLLQLNKVEAGEAPSAEQIDDQLLKERSSAMAHYLDSFIASLMRTAKIEKSEEFLQK